MLELTTHGILLKVERLTQADSSATYSVGVQTHVHARLAAPVEQHLRHAPAVLLEV